ncbi:collagen alpha-2(I) chain-like [Vulpes lagopus]|uniref:collagen alpha-2(I) chain-like n=1 Tax=Vulpes lagopus TaxID=494514 RepID=UPI001BCA4809|nr:collagen alpha-2(I) chain-like [Vulpes lagopus]
MAYPSRTRHLAPARGSQAPCGRVGTGRASSGPPAGQNAAPGPAEGMGRAPSTRPPRRPAPPGLTFSAATKAGGPGGAFKDAARRGRCQEALGAPGEPRGREVGGLSAPAGHSLEGSPRRLGPELRGSRGAAGGADPGEASGRAPSSRRPLPAARLESESSRRGRPNGDTDLVQGPGRPQAPERSSEPRRPSGSGPRGLRAPAPVVLPRLETQMKRTTPPPHLVAGDLLQGVGAGAQHGVLEASVVLAELLQLRPFWECMLGKCKPVVTGPPLQAVLPACSLALAP